jgi:hypothetical protein
MKLNKMSEHRKDIEFLRRLIVYADTEEHRELDRKIAQVQRDEHCVQRAAQMAVLFALAAMAGLAYVTILGNDFPYSQSQLFVTILYGVGLASLICLVGFAGILTIYRLRLNRLREECRQLVKRLVEPHLEKSRVMAPQHDRSDPADPETASGPMTATGSPEMDGSEGKMTMGDKSGRSNDLSAA